MRDHVRCPQCEGCVTCGIHTGGVTCNETPSTPQMVSYSGPPLTDEQLTELREKWEAAADTKTVSGWLPFDVHDSSNTTPRAWLQINTGGNSSSCLLEPVKLDCEPDGPWVATYEDESIGIMFRGEGTTAHGAMLSLLAARLGICARDVILSDEPPF